MALLAQLLLAAISVAAAQEDPEVTHNVFFDVKIGDEEPKPITIGLFGGVVPKTVANMLHLCAGSKGSTASGVAPHL